MGEERGVHRVLVWKPEGKRPLRKPRRRWEDNMKKINHLKYVDFSGENNTIAGVRVSGRDGVW
jgi:hypothetical protein